MQLNREALRAKLPDPIAVIREANRLGYCRGQFENGLEAIVTSDGADWISAPMFTMRQARDFARAWSMLPALDMGR